MSTDRGTGTGGGGGGGGGRINHYYGQNDPNQQQQQHYQPPYQAQGAYQQPQQPPYYASPEGPRPSLPPRHSHSSSYSGSSSSRPHTVPPPQTSPYDRPPLPGAFPAAAPTTTPYPYPPAVNPPPTHVIFTCNSCSTNLTHRPRIKCIQCPNFDTCTTCYLLRRVTASHESWHSQQTILPPPPLTRHKTNPQAVFNCDVCCFDISASPRARCLECVNFDLCADCHVMKLSTKDGSGGATGREGHLPTHKMNVITDWQPETREKLVNEEYYPSNLYLDMIDAIFNFIFENYHPPLPEITHKSSPSTTTLATVGGSSPSTTNSSTASTNSSGASSLAMSLLSLTGHGHRRRQSTTDRSTPGGPSGGSNGGGIVTPSSTNPTSTTSGATPTPIPSDLRITHELLDARKLALFYRAMGMLDTDNHYLTLPPPRLIHLYSRFGLEYHLIPSPQLRISLSNRVFPWQIDHVDTTPTEPALTRAGFRRSFVLGTFLNPEGTHFILQNLLSTGGLVNPLTKRPFRAWVPRDTLPRRPLEELLAWEKGLGLMPPVCESV
ncbi:hypothetical protein DFH27DRAFT_614867 [Peziza echinospora]|nr:hypothetical protein DFH27DRAFT_614867 [Peziza echinospora]